ncbi:MAG: hypothetical protein AB9897_08435 [Anaerolineaceae bacterium]
MFYPILILLLIIQTAIVRYIPLFSGTADLLLLWLVCWGLHNQGKNVWIGAVFAALIVSFVSAIPWYATLASYLLVVIISRYMNRRFWHNPLIALILVVFICGCFEYFTQYLVLIMQGYGIVLIDAMRFVIVPSVLLNLLLAIPIYAIVNDMTRWIYPLEVNE